VCACVRVYVCIYVCYVTQISVVGVSILITWRGVRGATDRKISAFEECRIVGRRMERVEEGKSV
jgi:hypothetical protein